MAKQYCIQELRKRLGFQEVEEIALSLLSQTDPFLMQQEAMSILGEGPSTDQFIKELSKRMKSDKAAPKPKAKTKQKKQVCLFYPAITPDILNPSQEKIDLSQIPIEGPTIEQLLHMPAEKNPKKGKGAQFVLCTIFDY